MSDYESIVAVEPDIEVVVRSGEYEIAVIGVFQNKSNVWDIIVGVDDQERREQLTTLFTALASAVQIATFASVHEAGIGDAPENRSEHAGGESG